MKTNWFSENVCYFALYCVNSMISVLIKIWLAQNENFDVKFNTAKLYDVINV